MNRLAGKTAIVTGGAVGIGRACVQRMAEEGAKFAIFDVLETEGPALASEIIADGHEVGFWPFDVSDETALRSAIDAAATRFGSFDVLVYYVGISGSPKPTDQLTEAEWDNVQAVNVKGVFRGTIGEPDDIAWAVVWLASNEAKFVTGAEVVIYGGYTA